MTHQGSAPDGGTALFFTDFARYMFDGITGYHSDRQARACKKFPEILGPANEDLLTQAQLAQSFMQIELS